jgi:hypothetical protein
MRLFATIFLIGLLAAGCRGDYPSLGSAPTEIPRDLIIARDKAPDRIAKIISTSRLAANEQSKFYNGRAYTFLKTLQVNELTDAKYVNEAARLAQESGSDALVMAYGNIDEIALSNFVNQLKSYGVKSMIADYPKTPEATSRVELYLAR